MTGSYDRIDGSSFILDDKAVQPLCISLEGLEGSGKTYLGLMTGPLPVVHVNFSDRQAESFLYDMTPERRAGTVLYNFRPETPKGWTRAEGQESLLALSQVVQAELGDGRLKGGTFILDGGSSWWETVQDVYVAPELERQQRDYGKQVGGLAYGAGNLIVKGILNWMRNQGAFTIITHQLTQVWDAKGPVPSQWRAKQNNNIPFLADVVLRLSTTCNQCGSPECHAANHVGRTHWAQIVKAGKRTDLVGMSISSLTMSSLYGLITGKQLPGVPEETT
jgi:hypothetical protein